MYTSIKQAYHKLTNQICLKFFFWKVVSLVYRHYVAKICINCLNQHVKRCPRENQNHEYFCFINLLQNIACFKYFWTQLDLHSCNSHECIYCKNIADQKYKVVNPGPHFTNPEIIFVTIRIFI